MRLGEPLFPRIGAWMFLLSLSAGSARAANAIPPPPLATFDAATGLLKVTFGDAHDVVRFTYDFANNLIQLQQDPDLVSTYTPGPYLLVNGGQTVSRLDVKEWSIDLGAGDDKLLEPICGVPLVKIYGGPGNDVIKTPIVPVVHIYGGSGNDTINAEHSWTNFIYGEDGDDTIWGSSDGPNLLDGGSGTNYLYTSKDTWDASAIQTVMHHEGSHDTVFDTSSPTVYKFVSSGGPPVLNGTMTIYEMTAEGFDTLDFSAWKHKVSAIDLSSTNPQVVSVDGSGNPILTLQLGSYSNRVEKVIYPVLPPPGRSRDFDGDGKADLLFRQPSSGTVYLWLLKF